MPNKHGIKYIPKQFISIEKIFEVVVYFFLLSCYKFRAGWENIYWYYNEACVFSLWNGKID